LAESILGKWLYYQKQSTFAMQSPSELQWHSSQRLKNQPKIHLGAQKTTSSQGNTEQKEQH
jgi:hypothetical protein